MEDISSEQSTLGKKGQLLLISRLSLAKVGSGRVNPSAHLLDVGRRPRLMAHSTVLHLSLDVAGSRSLGLLWLDVGAGAASVPTAEGAMEPVRDPRPRCRGAGTDERLRGQRLALSFE